MGVPIRVVREQVVLDLGSGELPFLMGWDFSLTGAILRDGDERIAIAHGAIIKNPMIQIPPADLLRFAIPRWRSETKMGIEDAYKWLFHASQGGDHAVGEDDAGPRRWMTREWATLGPPQKGEPEVVPLDKEGRLIRINLRPYRARGGDPEMLLALFVASARQFRPDPSAFRTAWAELGDQLKRGRIGKLSYPEWVRLDRETRPVGYPAIHHSSRYETARKPAYRVILGSLWPKGTTTP